MMEASRWIIGLGAGTFIASATACGPGDCTYFPPYTIGMADSYSPRSAPTTLIDAGSGKPICGEERVEVTFLEPGADAGGDEVTQQLYPYEQDCLYQFPGWQNTLGSSSVTLTVDGYKPRKIKIKRPPSDVCGLPEVPDLEYELEPDDD